MPSGRLQGIDAYGRVPCPMSWYLPPHLASLLHADDALGQRLRGRGPRRPREQRVAALAVLDLRAVHRLADDELVWLYGRGGRGLEWVEVGRS